MREDVATQRPQLLAALEEAIGAGAFERAEHETACAQPAIFCASLASYDRWHKETGRRPDLLAGHSLGEFAALVVAGVLDAFAALALVVERGRAMQQACEVTPGGMLALIGTGARDAAAAAVDFGVSIANDNAPEQLVVAGALPALTVFQAASEKPGVTTRWLPVAGAFHSPLMRPAVDRFHRALAKVPLSEPTIPVYSAMSVRPFVDVRKQLEQALMAPVRWRETVLALRDAGAEDFVEPGPGRVLGGLIKRSLRTRPRARVGALASG
ncbi:MAG TPA: ACP S-malonyltransferase [Solirubrobacteraceae bacterium]|jgi:malonyl CoA-acyl carrier protein transacylase|nr:ACP S-malonyltransferase [Solirubrobacteraceae bacterium]